MYAAILGINPCERSQKDRSLLKMEQEVLVALGANLPEQHNLKLATLQAAVSSVARNGLRVLRVSRFYQTPCFPPGAGPDYVNAVIVLLSPEGENPEKILSILHEVEQSHGRTREVRWGRRTLDLDLLAVGETILPDRDQFGFWHDLPADEQTRRTPESLILPHPRIQDRGFVLIPAMDVAPDWMHPVLGKTIAQMCADLPDDARNEVVAI